MSGRKSRDTNEEWRTDSPSVPYTKSHVKPGADDSPESESANHVGDRIHLQCISNQIELIESRALTLCHEIRNEIHPLLAVWYQEFLKWNRARCIPAKVSRSKIHNPHQLSCRPHFYFFLLFLSCKVTYFPFQEYSDVSNFHSKNASSLFSFHLQAFLFSNL